MKRAWFTLLLLAAALILPAFAARAEAAPSEAPENDASSSAEQTLPPELDDELSRQTSLLDLSPWQNYFARAKSFFSEGFSSLDDLLVSLAEGDDGVLRTDILSTLKELALREVRSALCVCAALTAAGMLTSLASGLPGEGLKRTFGLALSVCAVGLASGVFNELIHTASSAVGDAAAFTESTLPVMSTLLSVTGAAAAEGIFSPLMSFLSGTVVAVIKRLALPLTCACGLLRIAGPIAGGERLEGAAKLLSRAVRWMLGLVSAFYFAVTQVRGLTAAARDGVAIRTARYAIDRLVPVVGSMVSGTVDGVMACSLLIRNGAGVLALLLLFSLAARPLIRLAVGAAVFRAAAALCGPVSDPRIPRLYSGLADAASELFACAAAAVLLLTLTVCVFLASGGSAAGLW